MRTLHLLVAALALSACAPVTKVHEARLPLEVLRREGEAPRMGEVILRAGGYEEAAPFSFNVWFHSDGASLGKPRAVGWGVKFGDYCRDKDGWVQSVLVGPSGQVWRGFAVVAPAGPDRLQDWSSGYLESQDLLDAIAAGGRFTLALEDDEGGRWNEAVIDTLSLAHRERLFAANLRDLAAADPAMPVRGQTMLTVGETPRAVIPWPRRKCP